MDNSVKLILLPFAGGSSYSYNNFIPLFPANIELVAVEIPGRGKRSKEKSIKDAREVTEDIYNQIKQLAESGQKYAIFGHSMGALLGYLLTHKLAQNNLPLPVHLIASGRGGPSHKDEEEMYHLLPYDKFIDKLREMGGSPKEVLEHEALMMFLEPIIRADFQLVETYKHEAQNPLNIPITVLIGDKDEITPEIASKWQVESTLPVTIKEYSGGHFFIYDHQHDIAKLISSLLSS